ncbi:activator-dependent family glycosyltransferase [Saccharothrix australiensis]|uniref:Glycosyltransferase (Activator-dependent family) n=1 Tax=Saccharothrix australiensis TaxID=2072 RepID=A0A495VZR1_9PSEU|nr:activator-dependent family glycosyltransferase [Saccharothrix australiensis]RKT54699.1 glycosyltransferase (activator-dependent family) [Saccharothrix australiensis]
MRVLFTTVPEPTVFRSTVPLAWALLTAGHEVRVAVPPALTGEVTRAGLTAVPVGRDRDIWQSFETRPAELAALRTALLAPYDAAVEPDVPWEHLKAAYDYHVTWWHKMDAFPVVGDLVAFARHWRPDLVVWEPTTFAGAIAAKAVGAAHARLLWGLDVFGVTRDRYLRLRARQPRRARGDALADWLGQQAGRFGVGFSEDMTRGDVTIDPLPDSLRMSADVRRVPMRHVPYDGPVTTPAHLPGAPDRPRVLVALGGTGGEAFGGYPVRAAEILDALGDLDVEVVAALDGDPPARLPANAVAVPPLPLSALLPGCAAVVHHPGPAGLAAAALHGVPQLVLPVHADDPPLADRVAERGAGVVLHSTRASGRSIRDHLLRLLGDAAFGRAADRLRAEMLAMPAPHEVVGRLVALVAGQRSGG